MFSACFLFTIQSNEDNRRCPHYYLCFWQFLQIKKRHHNDCLAWSTDSFGEFFVVVSEYQFGFFFCLFWRWNDTKLCFFFLLWACWNKFQHGRRPLGWFFKHAIASLWRLGDAVKLAKLGTRTQKIGPSQQETTFLNTLWVLHTFVFVCLLFFTRM